MSVAAIAWAMDQNVPPTPSHVLLILANYADAGGVCWPSLGTVASKSRLSERAIRAALRVLEEAGVILRLSAGTGGRATSTRYQLQLGKAAAGAGYPKNTRQQAPGNGIDTRHDVPGKAAVVTGQNPASGAENPAPAAPDPSRTVRRKKEGPPLAPPRGAENEPLPDWMPSVWSEWEAYRLATTRRSWTPQVRRFAIARLDALRRAGNDPAEVISQAIAGGHTGFVAVSPTARPRPVHRDGMAEVLVELQQARRAGAEPAPLPVVNRFLAPGSGRRDN